ncbi:dihydrolipoyl dehydrogenase family protein [Kineococcus sp. SYSU DK004]|uniref:dihydrolipoyl dehydrogenase family protein n=1 Tax=Kineococcus sp. SYSU DK004 TaxID=3383125 RepID=UPI003D7C6552
MTATTGPAPSPATTPAPAPLPGRGAERPWDLLVVGGGTAGMLAARTGADLGARVLLVERDRTGGECLWTGCVPSKALLAAAGTVSAARAAQRYGLGAPGPVDDAAVLEHVRSAVRRIAPVDSPEALRARGVTVARGEVRLVGPGAAVVDGRRVRFERAVLATGSAPAVPPAVAALDPGHLLTHETLWDAPRLPGRVVVLGGGSSGCEFAQALARLGREVVLVEAGERLLPAEDPAAAAVVRAALEADGARVLTSAAVTGAHASPGGGVRVQVGTGAPQGVTVEVDAVLVAAGRVPRTAGLGCEDAGVALDERGAVVVDERLRTSSARVWAAGDVTARPRYTHTAGVDGTTAALNALLGLRRRAETHVPRATFTDPEVAATGTPTGGPLPDGWRLLELGAGHVDRAVADDRAEGFTRLVVDRGGRVRGATVVSPRAGEVLAELQLALTRGLRVRDLVASTHPYPTYADGPWNAAVADLWSTLSRPPAGTVLRGWASARRGWSRLTRR